MMMMKAYQKPWLSVNLFEEEEVVRTSNPDDFDDDEYWTDNY